ncbi:succinate dehydrogenase, hydrophobic membrane anchor protein [Devosia sp.]|uniref:succinate dehydrogenase, hydrophobic membrane anchor protein n=1 Tax=Devosia sp. TaxID=1871048 RepID=UPI003A93BD35
MIDRSTIANPKSHYGDPKKATKHFIWQRATGALNIVFAIFVIWLTLSLAGADAAGKIALVRNPLVAAGLILLFISVAVHMRIGMHEIIDDYVDAGPRHTMASAANTIFAALVAVVAILAIVKLVFWG